LYRSASTNCATACPAQNITLFKYCSQIPNQANFEVLAAVWLRVPFFFYTTLYHGVTVARIGKGMQSLNL
jgi:hypothetical protein